MKARKERYTVAISETLYREMQLKALRSGARQGVAAAMVALEKNQGYGKKRLQRVLDGIQDVFKMPAILGRELTAVDAITHLKQQYSIDVNALEIDVDLNCKVEEPDQKSV